MGGVGKMAVDLSRPSEKSTDLEPGVPPNVFYYSPLRYLQTMVAIAWAALAHPFSSTVINLTTGEVRHDVGEDEA
jgi:hypothetical protein